MEELTTPFHNISSRVNGIRKERARQFNGSQTTAFTLKMTTRDVYVIIGVMELLTAYSKVKSPNQRLSPKKPW